MSRQAFYKRDDEILFRRLAIEQFVKEVRENKDPQMGADNLWHLFKGRISEEYRVGRDVFRFILHERGLNIQSKKRAPRTADSRHNRPTYPNLVKDVIPTRPNQIWVSDITYVPFEDASERLGYRFCFLTLIMDAYSKRILGRYVAPTLETEYCIKALRMAIDTLPDSFTEKLIHHSDRGCQYASADYFDRLTKNNISPSMTECGNPKDNAMAERINNTIKDELLHGKTFTSMQQVVEAVDNAIEFYNQERPHSSLDWHTPNEAHEMIGEIKKHWHSWREDAIRRERAMAI